MFQNRWWLSSNQLIAWHSATEKSKGPTSYPTVCVQGELATWCAWLNIHTTNELQLDKLCRTARALCFVIQHNPLRSVSEFTATSAPLQFAVWLRRVDTRNINISNTGIEYQRCVQYWAWQLIVLYVCSKVLFWDVRMLSSSNPRTYVIYTQKIYCISGQYFIDGSISATQRLHIGIEM